MAFLLKNIKKIAELVEIDTLPHHQAWTLQIFDFPSDINEVMDKIIKSYKLEKINNILNLQKKFLELNIYSSEDDEMEIEGEDNVEVVIYTNSKWSTNGDKQTINENIHNTKHK